ncbi:MAG: NADH-quinone oxidoreductase subunit NuoH [Planctomycetia bacterium]|nr:NADH-quinone oxidoreductase subunit NuoH [Planctomycetia bacterium]
MTNLLYFQLGLPLALAHVIVALVACFLLINLIAVGALFFIWLERKVSGRIQDRLGPTRVGGKFGWLQTLADGLKLITKEDLMPKGADALLFRLAPYISFCASFCAFIALPFATGWVGLELNVAAFFVLAVLGLEVFGVILAGYSSASKWSLFGAMREAAQVVSYEVPLGMCVLVPVLIAGSMDLTKIGNLQAGWFTNWYIFHDPFTFVTFWVFFTCAVASVNRAPFDLAEAESELVAGFHTEYSGLRWSFFFMAEYGSMFLVSGLGTVLFFGGWNGPIPVADLLGLSASHSGVAFFIANLLGMTGFIFKSVILVTVMIWIRWTLPRLRIDQVITTCWKYCTPIAAVMFTGVVFWQALGIPSGGDLAPRLGRPAGASREGWLMPDAANPTVAQHGPAAHAATEAPTNTHTPTDPQTK